MNFRNPALLACLILFFCAGCQPVVGTVVAASAPTPIPTVPSTPTLFVPNTPSPTAAATATVFPSAIPTPTWTFQQGTITCPILLYHRIDYPPNPKTTGARYYVTPENFAAQMKALQAWGYTTISMSLLVQAITQGAALPERPIVISFDDGDISVYKNALPVMAQYGFTGVNYIVANRLNTPGFMNPTQLRDLAAQGWEVGLHGMSHIDLAANHTELDREVRVARETLEDELGLSVTTFAYPFATYDEVVVAAVQKAGFGAAMGVGTPYRNSLKNLYYLSRIEIRYSCDLDQLAALLPWSGGLEPARP